MWLQRWNDINEQTANGFCPRDLASPQSQSELPFDDEERTQLLDIRLK
jgi:hypothetical protein